MARPIIITKQLDAADPDGIAQAQAVAAAGNLTLNGALVAGGVATFDTARRVGITSAGNDSGITFTVYGTNYAGTAISETVTGANVGVAETDQDFLTVTRIAASGAAAGNVSVGSTDKGSTQWFVPDSFIVLNEIAVGLELLSGAATFTVECTDDSPLVQLAIYQPGYDQTPPVPKPFGWPGLIGLIADAQGDINRVCAGIRLTVTAGTGEVQMTLRQAGIFVS